MIVHKLKKMEDFLTTIDNHEEAWEKLVLGVLAFIVCLRWLIDAIKGNE